MATSTQPLVDALAVFTAGVDKRWQALNNASTNKQVDAALDAEEAALNKVRKAFYEITKDRNSREAAFMADITFMRKIAALGEIAHGL